MTMSLPKACSRKRKWPWCRARPLAPAAPAMCAWPTPPPTRRLKRRSTAWSALCADMARHMPDQDYNPQDIELKWLKRWDQANLYQADLDQAKRPFFNLMEFPYPSG